MKKFLSILAVFGVVIFIFGLVGKKADANQPVFNAGTDDELENAKQISLGVLRNRAAQRALGNVDEFKVQKVEIDELKMAHTKVRQTVDNIPVWEGEATVHLNQDGSVSTVTDDLKEMIAVSTTPNFSEREALRIALGGFRGKAKLSEQPTVDLWIFRGEDRDHLAYRVIAPRVDGTDQPSVPVDFIDAHTGERIFGYDNLQTGSGSSLYSGTVSISTTQSGSTYYMEDTTRRMGTFNMNNTGNETYGTGGTQSRYTDTDDVWNTTIQRAGVDAHYGAAMTYDYYKNVHGRSGIDGNNGPGTTTSAVGGIPLVVSRVHFGSTGRYNNAFWYNNQMSYGDGDGTNFSPLTTLDICGHEMTHGVTERTANLTYARESGALNEAWSDMFGAMVELYARGGSPTADTWKIGEQAYTPSNGTGDALRYMDDPTRAGDPDHYSERLYPGSCTPSNSNDQCGVHTNSAIANKAFYLIVAGGTHPQSGVSVTGIGPDAGAKIFYRALTVGYMTSGTTFAGARTATLNAATDLFGASSAQYNSVANGWCAVGVGTCAGSGTPTPTPTVTPTPTPGGGGNLLVNGGFEGSASPWVGSGTGYFYVSPGNYPHGGTGYIYFGVNNSVSGQAYQQVTIPATAAGTLTFWLNVTSSETTTTTQYDKLFVEVRNTSGTLLSTLATYSNLNKVASAATYSQKSLNVSAYRGQTVRIQFRSTTDSSVTTTFRVDDAALQ
ncbi:MAG TPA: M4 family metallopeptidase [Pyrinomonadaceae bacterium]